MLKHVTLHYRIEAAVILVLLKVVKHRVQLFVRTQYLEYIRWERFDQRNILF